MAHASATVSGDAIQKAAARLAAHGAPAAASWWAEAPHARGSGLNASAISSSQNRMCGCSTVRSVRGAGQQGLQHGAECVAWAAHGMPESPREISRPG